MPEPQLSHREMGLKYGHYKLGQGHIIYLDCDVYCWHANLFWYEEFNKYVVFNRNIWVKQDLI